jgi:alkylated DNA repair dioxygenase AlkB
MTEQFLCIPEIGSVVKLVEDWSFALYREGRNWDLVELTCPNIDRYDYRNHGKVLDFITLQKDTELRVDRIYVRKGKSEYSSITFVIQATPDARFMVNGKGKKSRPTLKKVRFWAKLADVNTSRMLVIADKAADDTQEA